jgi:hypothetical protein
VGGAVRGAVPKARANGTRPGSFKTSPKSLRAQTKTHQTGQAEHEHREEEATGRAARHAGMSKDSVRHGLASRRWGASRMRSGDRAAGASGGGVDDRRRWLPMSMMIEGSISTSRSSRPPMLTAFGFGGDERGTGSSSSVRSVDGVFGLRRGSRGAVGGSDIAGSSGAGGAPKSASGSGGKLSASSQAGAGARGATARASGSSGRPEGITAGGGAETAGGAAWGARLRFWMTE